MGLPINNLIVVDVPVSASICTVSFGARGQIVSRRAGKPSDRNCSFHKHIAPSLLLLAVFPFIGFLIGQNVLVIL